MNVIKMEHTIRRLSEKEQDMKDEIDNMKADIVKLKNKPEAI